MLSSTHSHTDGCIRQREVQCLDQESFNMWPGDAGSRTTTFLLSYSLSLSCVRILGKRSISFTVLRQSCPLSPILRVISMDRITMCSHGEEGVWFGNIRVTSLLFAGDVVAKTFSAHWSGSQH